MSVSSDGARVGAGVIRPPSGRPSRFGCVASGPPPRPAAPGGKEARGCGPVALVFGGVCVETKGGPTGSAHPASSRAAARVARPMAVRPGGSPPCGR